MRSWKQKKAEREFQEVEKVVKENETLKEIEIKQAFAEAKNQQSSDVPEENDSEDITDSKVFDKEDVEGIETMVYVINESLNVSDLVEDKSKNSSQVDTNKEVHNCVAKGFSSDKEKEFTKEVLVEKVYDEVQTKEKGSLSNCYDCAMMSTCKNDLKVHIEMYTCASEHLVSRDFGMFFHERLIRNPLIRAELICKEIKFLSDAPEDLAEV